MTEAASTGIAEWSEVMPSCESLAHEPKRNKDPANKSAFVRWVMLLSFLM
jgi:hypothetical protein